MTRQENEKRDLSNSTKNYTLVTYDSPIGKHKEEVNRCGNRFNFTSEVGFKFTSREIQINKIYLTRQTVNILDSNTSSVLANKQKGHFEKYLCMSIEKIGKNTSQSVNTGLGSEKER